MNIPVVAATGNSFTGQQGEGFAAIVAGTISVTATDLSGNLLSDAQRLGTAIGGASATTIAAPGEGLTAPSGDSGTSTVEGTSFATALVSGAIVLLQQIYESRFGTLPTVAQIKSWLQGRVRPDQRPGHRHHDRRARYPQGRRPDPDRGLGDRPGAERHDARSRSARPPWRPRPAAPRTQTTTTAHGTGGTATATTTAVTTPDSDCRLRRRPAPQRRPRRPRNQAGDRATAGDQSDASGNGSSGSAPPAVSGLARCSRA